MPRAQRTEGIGPWMRYIRAGRGPELGRATNIFLHPGSLQLSRLLKQTSLVKEIVKWPIFRFLLGMGKQENASRVEHKTCDILAAERLRLMRFDNRLIIDSFQS